MALTGRMLDSLILPSDARPTTDRGLPAALHAPLQIPGTQNVLSHRVWKLRGDPRIVARFVYVHQPRGYGASGVGTPSEGRKDPEPAWTVDDEPRVLPPNVSNAEIDISIASTTGRAVLLRADSVVGWTAPRPANEFVPASDRVVTVSVVHIEDRGRIGKRVVTADPLLVQPIVWAFNAERVAAPPVPHTSPAGGIGVAYRVAFASSARAHPDIVAQVDLDAESVLVNGRRAPALVDNGFSTAAAHVLGLSEPHWG